jgi:hypothetical protein
MKFVKTPEPVQIKNLATGGVITVDGDETPWTIYKYLVSIVLPDPAMGKGYQSDRARASIREAFSCAEPGEFVGVEDEHYGLLRKTVEEPESTISPQVTMQLIGFQDAIIEARRDKPKVLTEIAG